MTPAQNPCPNCERLQEQLKRLQAILSRLKPHIDELWQLGEDLRTPPPEGWYTTSNPSTGSLSFGNNLLNVGDVIEIQGDQRKTRKVTNVVGGQAYFKGHGEVPTGQVVWRVVPQGASPGAAGS